MVLSAVAGAAAEVTEPAPAWPELTSETSCSTPAPLGSSRPMAATSAVKSSVRTLTTIALPAGAPSCAGGRVGHHRVDPADAERAERHHAQPLRASGPPR